MIDVIPVALASGGYDVRVGRGLGDLLGTLDGDLLDRVRLVVVDQNVWAAHEPALRAAFARHGADPVVEVLPAGEGTKSLASLDSLARRFVAARVERSDAVAAVGGGVTCDVTGFVASVYHRGIDWIAVPTTVLAMLDAAIGGKTGVNLDGGKNLIGSFHQPRGVLCDLDVLVTLPPREHVSGLAEAVKSAVIADRALFERIAADADGVRDCRSEVLAGTIAGAVAVKAGVVADDERESGRRAILNFGHTVGHALESATAFGRWTHGEAISVGMAVSLDLSVRVLGLAETDRSRVVSCLAALGLPTADPSTPAPAILTRLAGDKKSAGGEPRFVLTERIGSASFGHRVAQSVVVESLAAFFAKEDR